MITRLDPGMATPYGPGERGRCLQMETPPRASGGAAGLAWLTVIGPAVEQVDYRLQESAGCGLAHGHEPGGPAVEPGAGDGQEHAQVDYRMDETNRLTWFGG